MHLVKELKSIEIKLSPALAYLVDIKLIYHVFDREDLATHKDADRLTYYVDIFSVRGIPAKQRYRIKERFWQKTLVFVRLDGNITKTF